VLRFLEVQGYKLFHQAKFEFDGLTVLVGANGSGQSALWELITLFPALLHGEGSDEAFDLAMKERSSHGVAGILSWGSESRSLAIRLAIDDFTYELRIEPVGVPGASTADTRHEVVRKDDWPYLQLAASESGSKRYVIHGPPTEEGPENLRRVLACGNPESCPL